MISIQQFRSDALRVAEWQAVLAMPITQEVLSILLDDAPETKLCPPGLSPTDAAIFLGNGRGYRNHHDKLKAFGQRWPLRKEQTEEDYGAGPAPEEIEE